MIYIIILIYVIIAALVYKYVVNKGDQPVWEKIMMSIGWPLMIPLYGIYWLHKNL
jgi:hypothetical protein